MADKKQRVAVIDGREYPLRFELDDLKALESELGGKSAWEAITGGRVTEQVEILRIGIRHKHPTLTDSALTKRLQSHIDNGGKFTAPLRQAFWALIDSGLIGDVEDLAKLRRAIPDPEMEPEAEDEGGKAPGGAVPAASGL